MKKKIRLIGKDHHLTNRNLYFLAINSSKDIPEIIQLSSKHFACLIVWDANNSSYEEISDLIKILIKNGAAYICSWGKDCERVETVADIILADSESEYDSSADSVIMTTSHKDESLKEALNFFLSLTYPAGNYEKTMSSNLVITIGSSDWNDYIVKIMQNPESLHQ